MADAINPIATPELMQSGPTLGTDDDSDTNTIIVRTAGTVVAQIENILESIVESLTEGKELSISFAARNRTQQGTSERRIEQIKYPGRTTQEATKFGMGNECGANRTDSR